MAATPTELLAEDVGSLRESDRQVTESIKGLTGSVNDLRADFAGFRGSVETELHLIRTLGKFVAGFLVAILASGFTLAWQAGALSTEVKLNAIQVEKRMDKLEARFDRLEARFDRLEAKVDQRFDAIIQRLDSAAPKAKTN